MKFFIFTALFFFIFSTVPYAADTGYDQHMLQGKSFIESNNFEKAINEFAAALEKKPDDYKAALYLGVAHSRSGNHKDAERYLKKALRSDPLSPEVNLELGLLYEKIGIYEESGDFFMAVVEIAPGTAEAAVANEHLLPKERKPHVKNWSASLTIGAQYDSNVTITSDDSPLPDGISDEADERFFAYLNANYLHPFAGGISAGPTFSFYQSIHNDLDEFNTRQIQPGLAVSYIAGKRVRLGLSYAFEHTSVDEDTYLVSHNITPRVVISENMGFFSVLSYRYKLKDFKDTDLFTTNDDKDGTNHQVQISQHIPLTGPLSLRLSYSFDRDSADKDFWSYKGHKVYAGLKADLGKMWLLDLYGQFYRKGYDDEFSGTDKRRKDNTSTLSANLTKTILKTSSAMLDASLGYIYIDNSSNIEVFDYQKSIVSLTLRVAL